MTNLVILVGRIARDPETRTTQGGSAITSISVVTDRPARKEGKTFKDENGFSDRSSSKRIDRCRGKNDFLRHESNSGRLPMQRKSWHKSWHNWRQTRAN